jgi:hypothetical protein
MGQPDWATVKAADAAYASMIAAWVAAIATALAALFASFAVWWAKKAAEEAGRQAKAAMDSVEWSRKAAEAAVEQSKAAIASVDAAREQVAIMQKEMAWAEPQPIVILNISYNTAEARLGAVVEVKNVGEEIAFDVQLQPISLVDPPQSAIISAVRFIRLPALRKDERLPLKPMGPQRFGNALNPTKYTDDLIGFLQAMVAENAKQAELMTQRRDTPWEAGRVTIEYSNARGATFQQQFTLTLYDGKRIECHP